MEKVTYTKTITAEQSRRTAAQFNWGNIVAILIPFPLVIFWFGASMVIYAMNRHHPVEKVGHYTQIAAYRFYFITGLLAATGAFIPGGRESLWYYGAVWGVGILIMLPWSFYDLHRIRRDDWQDVEITVEEYVGNQDD